MKPSQNSLFSFSVGGGVLSIIWIHYSGGHFRLWSAELRSCFIVCFYALLHIPTPPVEAISLFKWNQLCVRYSHRLVLRLQKFVTVQMLISAALGQSTKCKRFTKSTRNPADEFLTTRSQLSAFCLIMIHFIGMENVIAYCGMCKGQGCICHWNVVV